MMGRIGGVGALEILLSQGRNDFVELTFDTEQNCYVATLMVKDNDEPKENTDLDELSPCPYDREFGGNDEGYLLKELVAASGRTMVEALLQLELAYRNTIGAT